MQTTNPIGITEMVLRDGHQSLIATRLRTEDMLPICDKLDAAGFWSLEVWGGATFDACLRFLREDPWVRLQKLRAALPKTRLQMLLRGRNLLGYRPYAADIIDAFVEKAATNGMDVFRIFDAMNDMNNMRQAIAAVKKSGKHAQGTICYTTSPVHSIGGFIDLAARLAEANCDSIAIKDMAGIMTPDKCGELVTALTEKTTLPVHVHTHSTSGMAPLCLARAAEAGAAVIDTVISPFSGGASHPATETMAAALAGGGRDSGLDMTQLGHIADYFKSVRPKYRHFESSLTGTDPSVIRHHVPGGMISNLSNQLREQQATEQIDEVLAEIPRVRADLGYPPLVTPTSQIVGAQAVLNVMTEERYKIVSKEVKHYFLGGYGKIPGAVNEEIKKLAIGDAVPLPPMDDKPEMERLKADIGDAARNDEDVLTYAMFPEVAKIYLQERAAGQLSPEPLSPPVTTTDTMPSAASEFRVTVHGETYHVNITGHGQKGDAQRPLYITIDGVPEEALIETLREIPVEKDNAPGKPPPAVAGGRPRPSKPGHVTTAMPGVIVSVPVAVGDIVQAGDPVLVVEAMKMETEIQAPISGAVISVLVEKGDSVTPDEALLIIGE